MKGVEAPPIGGLIRAIIVVAVVLFAGWLLLAWAVVKRPILGLPVAAFTGLVLLVGMHDAQALGILDLPRFGGHGVIRRPGSR